MKWFNAALYWLKCTVRPHLFHHKSTQNNSTKIESEKQLITLQSTNEEIRSTDTRAQCSVCLKISVSTHHDRLSALILRMQSIKQ